MKAGASPGCPCSVSETAGRDYLPVAVWIIAAVGSPRHVITQPGRVFACRPPPSFETAVRGGPVVSSSDGRRTESSSPEGQMRCHCQAKPSRHGLGSTHSGRPSYRPEHSNRRIVQKPLALDVIAAIPEEPIWLARGKSARTRGPTDTTLATGSRRYVRYGDRRRRQRGNGATRQRGIAVGAG